ncbi:MAG: S-layer homology domain-containing protein [Anaerotignum sp.]|nr:S-layer homology domain-containing protein [Anaerotignum sp.]
MKRFCRITAFCMAMTISFGSTAMASTITPSVTAVTLEARETEVSFDVILQADSPFAGAEFALKPSDDDVKIDVENGIQFLSDVSGYGTAKAERDGAVYFGFFGGSNQFPAKTYRVARVTYNYRGNESRTIHLIESSIVTINDDGKTTTADTTSSPFTVSISRKSNDGGGSGGSGGGGGGGKTDTGTNDTAVQAVIDLIKAIGKVTENSKPAIETAREAYDKLTASQKANVTNYKDLEAAEKALAALLQKDAEDIDEEKKENDAPTPTGEKQFRDVKTTDWFYSAVQYVVSKGLMYGTDEAIFEPQTKLNRGMLTTILYRMEGSPKVNAVNPFTDVAAGKWYTDAIVWANANDVVSGYGDGMFGPTDDITREQMALMIMRYCAYKGMNTQARGSLETYTDKNKVSTWAETAVKWAIAEKLITGRTETTLEPRQTATRAEAASILMRFDQNIRSSRLMEMVENETNENKAE